MNFNIDLLILILFVLANFIIGFGIRKRERKMIDTNDFKSYSLGKNINPSVLFLTATFTSSIISGGFFINLVQQSYLTGLPYIIKNVLIDPLSYVLTALIFVIPMHKNIRDKGHLTLNEWMDEKYHSTFLRALMGLAEAVSRLGMLSIQFKAFGTLTRSLFQFTPQEEKVAMVFFAVFLTLYVIRGGFISVVYTDILQFWVFIVALGTLIVFTVYKTHFFEGVWERGIVENPKISLASSFKNFDAAVLTLGLWVKTLFPKLNGTRYQRIMMTEDPKKARNSLIYAACITSVFITFCVLLALHIYSQNPSLKFPEIMPYVVKNYCPVGLKGLLGAGLLAMSISTADSILNSNSVILANDVLPLFSKMFSKKEYKPSAFSARIMTIVVALVGLGISLNTSDIFTTLMSFGNFYHPIATVPSILLVLGVNLRKESIFAGAACGSLATLVYYLMTQNMSSFFLGLIANSAGILLVELYLRKFSSTKQA